MPRPRINRNRVKRAIKDSGGVISVIAERTGYSWMRVREFILADQELAEMLRNEEEATNDIAESNVIAAIKKGDLQASRWWLSLRRRERFGVHIQSSAVQVVRLVDETEEASDDRSGD